MRFGRFRLAPLACLLLAACLLVLAGCGGSSADDGGQAGGSGDGGAGSGSGYVDWPIFGRVTERTHYLPAERRVLDPPLKEAWSINTHALIEFPPAIHDGVAYLINKYGNGKAVRLRDRKVKAVGEDL